MILSRLLRSRFLLLLFCGLFPLAALADPLSGFRAEYEITASGLPVGWMEVRLERDGGMYRYVKTTEPRGLLALVRDDHMRELSEGRIEEGLPVPEHYLYLHERDKGNRRDEFRVEEGQIRGAYKDRDYELVVPGEFYDRAAMELVLMVAMAEDRREAEIPLVDRGEFETYRFRTMKEETVEVPAGEFRAIKLTVVRKDEERQTRIWLAPELDYRPVRIVHRESPEERALFSELVKFRD